MRGVGEQHPQEKIAYSYWATTLHLLEIGIPYDAINQFTEQEINLILGVDMAIKENHAEKEASAMSMNNMRR